jgi:tetratricopeptide (TPR) repeat protein
MRPYDDIAAEDYYEMGLEWVRAKNPDKARDCLKRCIELNPNFIYAYVTLSEVLAGGGDYGEAAQVLKKASKLDPGFGRLNFLQAKYHYRAGDYPSAMRAIDRAIDTAPERLYHRSRAVIVRAMHSLARKQEKA